MKRLFLVCLAGLMLALPVAAQPGGSPQGSQDKAPVIFDFKKEIDITPEQESQMRSLLDELRSRWGPVRSGWRPWKWLIDSS